MPEPISLISRAEIEQDRLMYALSDRFTLYRRENELYKVVNTLKKLGQIVS